MKLFELLNHIDTICLSGSYDPNLELGDITSDSREKTVNGIFIAVKGLNSDGAAFSDQAVANGALLVVYETEIRELKLGVCYAKVLNSREAQAEIAAILYDYPIKKLIATGITGTNGKTSFCYILRHILNYCGNKCGLFGNIEYDLGREKIIPRLNTPEAIELQKCLAQMVKNNCKHVVMEVSSHGLALDRVYGMQFTGAVFSNLTQDHLDFHGNMENYAESKALLFNKYLKKDGFAVINADDEKSEYFRNAAISRVLTYGKSPMSDLVITNYHYSERGLIVNYTFHNEKFSIESNLEGSFQVYNLSAAVLTAIGYGVEISKIKQALLTDLTIPGRLQQINAGNFKIFIDYAHTPDALEKAINALKELKYSKITVVFGCGGNRDKLKRPIMGGTACSMSDNVIITSDNSRSENTLDIINDILAGVKNFSNYQVIENRSAAILKALNNAQDNSIVLIAGKGHENYQEINGVKHHFSDHEEVLKYLKQKEIKC